MKVNESFLSDKSEQLISGFFLNENRRESAGETRFDFLVRYGGDFFYSRVKSEDYWTISDNGQNKGNKQKYYHFCPIPQSFIDNVNLSDPNPPNNGY